MFPKYAHILIQMLKESSQSNNNKFRKSQTVKVI